jgi:hypothetical protein
MEAKPESDTGSEQRFARDDGRTDTTAANGLQAVTVQSQDYAPLNTASHRGKPHLYVVLEPASQTVKAEVETVFQRAAQLAEESQGSFSIFHPAQE